MMSTQPKYRPKARQRSLWPPSTQLCPCICSPSYFLLCMTALAIHWTAFFWRRPSKTLQTSNRVSPELGEITSLLPQDHSMIPLHSSLTILLSQPQGSCENSHVADSGSPVISQVLDKG